MKNNVTIYIIIVVLLLGGIFFVFRPKSTPENTAVAPTKTPAAQTQKEVVATEAIIMKSDSFEPANLTIKKNTKVIFKNEDAVDRWPASNIHPTHGIYPEFDPLQPIKPGQEWSFVFDKPGNWKMHDHLIPSITGTIIVTE